MAIVEKKINKEYFDLVASGRKKWEFRANDFDIEEGDTFLLKEWDPKGQEYTGRTLEKKVGLVIRFKLDAFGQEDLIKEKGIQIISLE
jgi:hypothetical protein